MLGGIVAPLRAGENMAMGGFAEKTLKNEKGERFSLPSESTVLTQAIGLGATLPNKS